MDKDKTIQKLQGNLPWDEFLLAMEKEGFVRSSSIKYSEISNRNQYKKKYLSGNIMLIQSQIHAGSIIDPSHLLLIPYVIFRPIIEYQLKKIILYSKQFKIPITFAGGKTGLSGAYANYGIIVDLANLHSFSKPYDIQFKKKLLTVEQSALVPDLIKTVNYLSKGELIFPIQPASALKLPVTIGGIISSNASGVTSGKLGSVENWVKKMRIIKPDGNIVEINNNHPLFKKIIGGNGYYGVILSATFKLYKPLAELKRAILFGHDIDLAFNGLQSILDNKIFPLISEFMVADQKLPGKFDELKISNNKYAKWAVIIKGKPSEIDEFIRLMKLEANCVIKILEEEKFQEYLQERSAFALIVQTSDTTGDYIAFPGFEDILSAPKNLPEIIKTINSIFNKNGFHKVIFGYGHINFRKGQGLLLHMRLPVPIEYFYESNKEKLINVSETVYEVIKTLREEFNIKHKAEHSPGIFPFFLDKDFRKNFHRAVNKGTAFINPHLMIYDQIHNDFIQNFNDNKEKKIFVRAMQIYLNC